MVLLILFPSFRLDVSMDALVNFCIAPPPLFFFLVFIFILESTEILEAGDRKVMQLERYRGGLWTVDEGPSED